MDKRQINKTDLFIDSSKKLEISQRIIESIEAWAVDAPLVQTKNFRLCFRSPGNDIAIWNAKLPDSDYKKGTSGGFRLLCIHCNSNSRIYLDFIERRKNMGSKEKPNKQKAYNERLLFLKNNWNFFINSNLY